MGRIESQTTKQRSMQYTKPWLSFNDQLNQLMTRGLKVTDKPQALDYLERIGYYRLSGYWYPFRERSGVLCLLDHKGKKTKRPLWYWMGFKLVPAFSTRWTFTCSTNSCDC